MLPAIQAVFHVKTVQLALHAMPENSEHSNQVFAYANKDTLSLSSKTEPESAKNVHLNARPAH